MTQASIICIKKQKKTKKKQKKTKNKQKQNKNKKTHKKKQKLSKNHENLRNENIKIYHRFLLKAITVRDHFYIT